MSLWRPELLGVNTNISQEELSVSNNSRVHGDTLFIFTKCQQVTGQTSSARACRNASSKASATIHSPTSTVRRGPRFRIERIGTAFWLRTVQILTSRSTLFACIFDGLDMHLLKRAARRPSCAICVDCQKWNFQVRDLGCGAGCRGRHEAAQYTKIDYHHTMSLFHAATFGA